MRATPFLYFSILLLFCLPAKALAQAVEPIAAYNLHVTPTVCVTPAADQRCEQSIRIEWQGLPTTRSACVYLDNRLLQCWESETKVHGNWEGNITWPENGTVSLTDESGAVVAEVLISVQSLKPRRRTDNRWSNPT